MKMHMASFFTNFFFSLWTSRLYSLSMSEQGNEGRGSRSTEGRGSRISAYGRRSDEAARQVPIPEAGRIAGSTAARPERPGPGLYPTIPGAAEMSRPPVMRPPLVGGQQAPALPSRVRAPGDEPGRSKTSEVAPTASKYFSCVYFFY